MAKKRANGEGNIRKRTDGTQGVGQRHSQHRCGSTFDGRGMVTFCAAGNNKKISKRRNRATRRRAMLPPGGSAGSWYASRMGQNVGQSVFNASRNGGRTS